MEDRVLVERAQRGERAAFAQLVERYQTPVYNLAYRMLGDANDAEDAAQETFLRAYARLKTFRTDQKFATWLLAIAAHYCIGRLRRRRFLWLSLDDEALSDALPSDAPEPHDEVLRREDQREIEQLLERLAPAHRLVIVLRYWYDLSVAEIAQATGDSVGAVKVRLHRAHGMLARAATADERPQMAEGGRRSAVGGLRSAQEASHAK